MEDNIFECTVIHNDVIKKDLSIRKHRFNIAKSLNRSFNSKENYEAAHRIRTIEEIIAHDGKERFPCRHLLFLCLHGYC